MNSKDAVAVPQEATKCPSCMSDVPAKAYSCSSCGTVLQLFRGEQKGPGKTLRYLNKFIWVGQIFLLLLIPLGMCIRPG
jgi:hypothetical protein